VSCEEINNRAIHWLRTHADIPFFLFIHYWDPHIPYTPPERYRGLFYEGDCPTDPNNHALDDWWLTPTGAMARDTWLRTADGLITDPAYITALYDQEIRYVDEAVGELVATLDKLGLAEQTLVMVLADHGESMTEHSIFFEHYGLYDCTLRVPLIARWPGHLPQGVHVSQLLEMTDIAPTLLEAVGLPVPDTIEGVSFWRVLTGEEQGRGHKSVVSLECTWQAKWSLRTDRYKFILARQPDPSGNLPRELYDLAVDPQEENNLIEEQPELAAAMEVELENWIAERLRLLGKEKDPLLEQGASLRQALNWYS
jgi:arylsulfatase A-like enzyme